MPRRLIGRRTCAQHRVLSSVSHLDVRPVRVTFFIFCSGFPLQDPAHIILRPGGRRDCNQSSRAACRSIRAPWASGWRAGDAALSAQRRVPDGVRPRVTREVRSGCVAVSLAECLVLWFCVSLLCDRHRPSCVHPYRVGVPVVGRTVFRLPINQSSKQVPFVLYVLTFSLLGEKRTFPQSWVGGFLLLGHKKESEELLIFKPQTLIQLVQDF